MHLALQRQFVARVLKLHKSFRLRHDSPSRLDHLSDVELLSLNHTKLDWILICLLHFVGVPSVPRLNQGLLSLLKFFLFYSRKISLPQSPQLAFLSLSPPAIPAVVLLHRVQLNPTRHAPRSPQHRAELAFVEEFGAEPVVLSQHLVVVISP